MTNYIPCIGCGRIWAHLDGCEVKRLHEQLDRKLSEYGLDCVLVQVVFRGISDEDHKRL